MFVKLKVGDAKIVKIYTSSSYLCIPVQHIIKSSNYQIIKSFPYFSVYSKLFIACCALAYTAKTSLLLYGNNGNIHVNTFVFSATLFAYCFWGINEKKHLVLYALLALSFMGALSQLFFMPSRAWYIIFPVGLIGLGYTFPVIPTIRGWKKLRDIYWLKILWIAFSFSWLTAFLPVIFIGSVSAMIEPSVLFIFARSFLFISAICIPFDIRDMKFDRRKGTNTLPVMQGINKSVLIAITLLFLFLMLVLLQHFYYGLGVRETTALFLSGFITMAVMPLAKPERSKLFFSLVYDGELLCQWALLMVFIYV